MKNRRIIVFGNQQIGIDCVELLTKNPELELVVVGCETSLDLSLGYASLKKYCQEKQIRYLDAQLLEDSFWQELESNRPEIGFSIYYRNVFDKKVLDLPRLGFVNIHPSLLPAYREPAPTMWALLT